MFLEEFVEGMHVSMHVQLHRKRSLMQGPLNYPKAKLYTSLSSHSWARG